MSSPSGVLVMTYCIRADAPGRSGWLSAILRVSSSHSCESHLAMSAPRFGVRCERVCPRTLPGDAIAHTGEQVVLGDGCLDQAPGQDVVVVGVDGAGDLRRQAEPERRVRVDLGGVGQQGLTAH